MARVILKCRGCGDLQPLDETSKNTVSIKQARGWSYSTEHGWRCPKPLCIPKEKTP